MNDRHKILAEKKLKTETEKDQKIEKKESKENEENIIFKVKKPISVTLLTIRSHVYLIFLRKCR